MTKLQKETSKADFDLYKREINKWLTFFGIKDYELLFAHDNQSDEDLGWLDVDRDSYTAIFGLTKDWSGEPFGVTTNRIKRLAFHECCELLLFPLVDVAGKRFIMPKMIEQEKHRIISLLGNTLFTMYLKGMIKIEKELKIT